MIVTRMRRNSFSANLSPLAHSISLIFQEIDGMGWEEAYCCPIQFLEPAEKGKKAFLSASTPLYFPSQRSGMNSPPSGQISGSFIIFEMYAATIHWNSKFTLAKNHPCSTSNWVWGLGVEGWGTYITRDLITRNNYPLRRPPRKTYNNKPFSKNYNPYE